VEVPKDCIQIRKIDDEEVFLLPGFNVIRSNNVCMDTICMNFDLSVLEADEPCDEECDFAEDPHPRIASAGKYHIIRVPLSK